MPGPAPKHPSQRRRRNQVAGARTLLPAILPADDRPQLLERPDGQPWHPAAVEMWNAVWASPMAMEFDPADTHALVRLLDLVHAYWSVPADPRALRTKVLLAAEIRLESQNFGITPLDRRRLQWEIERADEASARGTKRRSAAPGKNDPRTKY